jgi:hypothetical protein
MRRNRQPTSGLKLVMLFDRRNQTCCVCSHNLDAEEALQEVAELRRDGLPAFTVDQRSRHTEVDPDECFGCRAHIRQPVRSQSPLRRRKPTN